MEKALYIIPTTLGDTPTDHVIPSFNHVVIAQIKFFIVENVRSARRFLKKIDKNIDIDTLTFYELNEHTDLHTVDRYLVPLETGDAVGILSDAGCPTIADPGAAVIALAQRRRFRVIPLVGPSAPLLAIMSSGFNGQNFAFNGYLPAKPAARVQRLRQLETRLYKENQTQLFIETPYRNMKLIETMLTVLRVETKLCIAAGITCPEEYIRTMEIAEWQQTRIPDFSKIPALFALYR
ncbi:MAG: SAM-dependent methyltransferase [Treponema sp.]|nr:SAM-dependent methyltransferase [Treponema sp.]